MNLMKQRIIWIYFNKMKIYLDFDGTVVDHRYPNIGEYNQGSFEVIKKLQKAGHEIILNTYRADCNNHTLQESIDYLDASTEIAKIKKVETQKIMPKPWYLEDYIASGVIFIDDASNNVPLIVNPDGFPMVDWQKVDNEFKEHEIY